jgi:hypothetical protein
MSTTEHYEGRAVDWMFNSRVPQQKVNAEAVIAWLLAKDKAGNPYANARRLGVMYLIWNNKIWGAYRPGDGWRSYQSCDTPAKAAPGLESAKLQNQLTKIPAPPECEYQTEVNIAALDWIEELSARLTHGYVLSVDYGYARDDYYAPHRTSGTLAGFSQHRRAPSPLQNIGQIDITAHVEWNAIKPLVEKVMEAERAVIADRMRGRFGGGSLTLRVSRARLRKKTIEPRSDQILGAIGAQIGDNGTSVRLPTRHCGNSS